MADLPPGTLWVHCAAGYRASIAASLLGRAGRATVLVDGAVAAAHAA
jgi:hydroxyacylglutathione hydrolase